MLKTRIIPCILFKDRTVVKSEQFTNFRMVGDPTTVARVFNERNADEMIFLDVMATRENKEPNFKVFEDIAKECFMPLSIGGGIKTMEHADKMFRIGADKIVLNTPLVENKNLIKEIVKKYGSQAVIASIDAKKTKEGYKAFTRAGTKSTEFSPSQLAKIAEDLGVGEIFLNSIDNDGTTSGYDLDLIREVSSSINIPLIVCGGAGKNSDFLNAIKEGADAVCAASIFYYVGESIISSKKFLKDNGIDVRVI